MSSAYIEACNKKGVKPLKEAIQALESTSQEIKISSRTQTSDLDLLPLGSLLSENFRFLKELELTGQKISPNGMSFLAVGLQENDFLKKLTICQNGISSIESISTLCLALQNSLSLEYLDLSENEIEDQSAEALKELLKVNTSLKVVKLERNLITSTCFALSLCENQTLFHFSISYNPLDFDNCISLLEMLNVNTTLMSLSLKGVKFSGSAKIKENLSGVLSKEEALILKLANILRNSQIQSIAIDIDPKACIQLKELETSLIKHNSTLTSISSDNINWWVPLQGPLLGIQKALKANSVLNKCESHEDEDFPYDLESIIEAKKFKSKEVRSLKSLNNLDVENRFYSIESPNLLSSPGLSSPDFFASSFNLSEVKKTRTAKTENKNQLLCKAEEMKNKMFGFEEEVLKQIKILQDRVAELESKKSEEITFIARIQELEKKNEATQNHLMLLSREITELKAKNTEPEIPKFLLKFQNLEKKISENSFFCRNIQKQIEELDFKVLRIQCLDNKNQEECNKKSEYLSSESSCKSQQEGPGKTLDYSFPGCTEKLVLKVIQDRSYWSSKKPTSQGSSPHPISSYLSPDGPSKDLQDRLLKKGLNFVTRSSSSRRQSNLTNE